MSNFKYNQPIEHIPSFKEWLINYSAMWAHLHALDLKMPMGFLDSNYYFSDLEGWGKILRDLVFHSSLYKPDKFDCDDYALKAMSECAERYGLNTLGLVIGNTPRGRHGFNIFPYYDNGNVRFMLWEPNGGFAWSGQPFEIGDNGYQPDLILI